MAVISNRVLDFMCRPIEDTVHGSKLIHLLSNSANCSSPSSSCVCAKNKIKQNKTKISGVHTQS